MGYKDYIGYTKTYVVCRNEGFGVMEAPYEEKEVVFETDDKDEAESMATKLKIENNTPEEIKSSWVPNTYRVNINTLSEEGAKMLLQFKAEGQIHVANCEERVKNGTLKKKEMGGRTFYFPPGSIFDQDESKWTGAPMDDDKW